jgi:UDP-3-O-[3-hydroxymyristoyl] glucosamine N-acyltransferase
LVFEALLRSGQEHCSPALYSSGQSFTLSPMPAVSMREIAEFVGGQHAGDGNCPITGVASLTQAAGDQLSFLSNRKYAADLAATKAGAILVPKNLEGDDDRWIRVDDPYFALARIMTRWFSPRPGPKGISSKAVVAPSARLGTNVALGHFAIVGDKVVIGNNVTIFQGVSIEAGSVIGDDCIIYPNVVIYDGTRIGRRCIIHSGVVIGSDGYGFATHGGKHHKIPQIGIVRIEDDVEIGAGTTIDRAALGETVIGEGTKIDNLVQIGHNVRIGKHCLLVSQVGIAGSTELGDYVAVAGQSGFSGHLKIGHRVQVAAKSAVLEDVPDDTKVMGSPAVPFTEFARRHAALKKLARRKT